MNRQKGFTLIELLIVIVVLGILAVAILSAINPIEQVNKATDSGTQSDASELINALERYYASNQQWTWTAAEETAPTSGWTRISDLSDSLDLLVSSGEVKSEFITRDNLDHIYIQLQGTTGSSQYVKACFEPLSNTFKGNAKHYDSGTDIGDDARDGVGAFCVPGVEASGNNT